MSENRNFVMQNIKQVKNVEMNALSSQNKLIPSSKRTAAQLVRFEFERHK